MSLAPFLAVSVAQEFRTDPLGSILPTSSLIEEEAAVGLGLDRIHKLGPVEFLNLTTYMISNNFPGEANGREIYNWLKARGGVGVLGSLASIGGITTKALLEGILRLAVEAGDTLTAKELLKLKVNPNGHQIRLKGIVGTLNILQHACLTGNTGLAQVLIEAGATGEEDKTGWKRSILTLAIVGEYKVLSGFYNGVERAFENEEYDELEDDDCTSISMEYGSACQDGICCDYHKIQRNEAAFIELIESLIGMGAKVVFVDADHQANLDLRYDDDYCNVTPLAFKGCDTPLAAAAKYKQQYILDRFLGLGADPNFLSDSDTSPLQECFFSYEESVQYLGESNHWTISDLKKWTLVRSKIAIYSCKSTTGIARSLLQAYADLNQGYRLELLPGYCTPLDIAALGGSENLVRDFLTHDAMPNNSSLEYAIHGGSLAIIEQLLDVDAQLTQNVFKAAFQLHRHDFFKILFANLWKRGDPLSLALATIEAIRWDVTEDLLDLQSFDFTVLYSHIPLLQEAVNDCCSTGRTGLFFKLLESQHALRVILLPMIPSALNSLVNAHVYSSELCEAFIEIVEIDGSLIAACSEALLSAIQLNQDSIAIRLIKAGVPLNRKLLDCSDPNHCGDILVAAIYEGSETITHELLKAGADVNARGQIQKSIQCSSITPLEMAVKKSHAVCVKTFLPKAKYTAEHSLCCNTGHKSTCCCDLSLVQNLLGRGANPFDEGAFKAARFKVALFQTLLNSALDKATRYPHVASGVWDIVFGIALLQKNPGLALMIMERLLDPNLMCDKHRLLYVALNLDCGPDYTFIDMLLRCGADLNEPINTAVGSIYRSNKWPESPLMVAITLADHQKVEFLLQNGAHINMPSDLEYKHSALQHAIRKRANKQMVTLLLEWKADPNFCTEYELTPLQLATEQDDLDLIKLLLVYGANPNFVTYFFAEDKQMLPGYWSNTCLQNAAEYGNTAGIKLLLEYQADANMVPKGTSHTPLQIAATQGNITLVKLLLEHQADPNLMPTKPSHTPLQIAARDGNKEMTEMLLASGANTNAPPCLDSGATALQFAAIGGYLGIAFLLLDYKVNINAAGASTNGRTALEGAAEHGRIDMIKMLLNAGVDVHGKGQMQYERALNFASNNGHHAARELMEEYHG